MKTGIVWVRPPSALADAVEKYGERVYVALRAVADQFASILQDEARREASWTDRTGNARSGIFTIAEQAAQDAIEIYLSHGHSIEYGKWLELAHGGQYAVIMPTLEKNLPRLMKMLENLFKD